MKQFIVVRGLPGSGKSTFASLIAGKDSIVAADDFLYVDGKYVFTPERLKEAQRLALAKFIELVKAGEPLIVYTGVSPDLVDVRPYEMLAKEKGYSITYLVVENRHGKTSIHDVPSSVVKMMRSVFKISL